MTRAQRAVLASFFNDNFERSARDASYWYGSGEMNQHVARLFHRRYLRAHENYLEINSRILDPVRPLKKISKTEMRDMSLHRYILMFYGAALECYLKAYIVKRGLYDPLQRDSSGKWSLKPQWLNHTLQNYVNMAFPTSRPAVIANNIDKLNNLTRAVYAGKYFCEKNGSELRTYTGGLDETVAFAKKLINILKRRYGR